MNTPDRGQSKTLILSTDVDQKLLETQFFIAICRPTGDKWQSKTVSSDFLSAFVDFKEHFRCDEISLKSNQKLLGQ